MGKEHLLAALRDLTQGARMARVWSLLAWQEVRQRYRRSILGPFWLTISMGAMVAAVGPLYGRLLNQDVSTYFPYLAISLVLWNFLASLTNESCQSFIAAEEYIRNVKLPMTVHVMRVVWRNLIIFAHNFVIVVVVYLFLAPPPGWHLLELPLGLIAIVVNAIWIGLLLGMLCARFRDIPQIVASLVQVTFFLTPVLWKADMLGRHILAAQINPYFHFLEAVRQPLLGQSAGMQSWLVVLGITVAGFTITLLFFARFRSRIAYWV
ncbi:MAG: ABC transporter permease [Burkholderiales bacterium]|nr:ABC transporter permease [Burkholderiales bacterium]